MSPYTTRRFTRSRAIEILKEAITDPATTNVVLEDMLDAVLKDALYNALISSDYCATEEHEGYNNI